MSAMQYQLHIGRGGREPENYRNLVDYPLLDGDVLHWSKNEGARVEKTFASMREAQEFAKRWDLILDTSVWVTATPNNMLVVILKEKTVSTNPPRWIESRRPDFASNEDLEMTVAEARTPEMMRILEMRRACLDFIANLEREGWLSDDSQKDDMRYIWDSITREYEANYKAINDVAKIEDKDFSLPQDLEIEEEEAVKGNVLLGTFATVSTLPVNASPLPPDEIDSIFEKMKAMRECQRRLKAREIGYPPSEEEKEMMDDDSPEPQM